MTPPPFMKTTSTTKANRLDGRTAQPGRASRFASAPTCSLSQVVWVVSNCIEDHGTLDGAGGVGGLLATEVGGVWYFPLYDNNGNITDYVSETGEVVASYAYDAFGRTIAQSGAMASVFPFRFSTKYYDAESGLYYYGYRYYSPELGRWMTRDPIEEDGGDNLYAFCGNNGVGKVDPFGLSCIKFETKQTDGTFVEISSYDEIGVVPRESGRPGQFNKQQFAVRFSRFKKMCCEIKLQPYISVLASLSEIHKPNEYVGYVLHTIVGETMEGGRSLGTIRPATIAHEKGHAKAYFEIAKPELERQLESYCGKRYATVAEQNRARKEIQNIIDSIVLSKSFLEVSAKLANEATLNFYNSSDYDSIVPPIVPFLPEEEFDYLWRKK